MESDHDDIMEIFWYHVMHNSVVSLDDNKQILLMQLNDCQKDKQNSQRNIIWKIL